MRKTMVLTLLALACSVLVPTLGAGPGGGSRPGKVIASDDFEAPTLSPVWETSRFAPGAVAIQSRVVRAGHGAAMIVLHPRDTFETGVKGKDTERDELREARELTSKEDTTYEYSFSLFLPADFPIVPTRLVIAQWKQYCPSGAPCEGDSPVAAIRYSSGVLSVTLQAGPQKTTLFETKDEIRGRWLDFRFEIRFSTREAGRLKAWLGDKLIADFTCRTAYPEGRATGYPNPGRFYFKMGLYRDLMSGPMTIYVDEYRKVELPNEGR